MRCSKIIFAFFIFYFAGIYETYAQDFKAKNLNMEWRDDDKLLITYDLSSEEDNKVEVKIYLMSDDDSSLKIEVKSASGNIGIGYFSGEGNEVLWDIYDDYPDLREEESFYFTLEATVVKDSGGWPWYYYVGGGVVAGAATFLITNPGGSSSDAETSGFPQPPSRN